MMRQRRDRLDGLLRSAGVPRRPFFSVLLWQLGPTRDAGATDTTEGCSKRRLSGPQLVCLVRNPGEPGYRTSKFG
jgi:hypothetical protein